MIEGLKLSVVKRLSLGKRYHGLQTFLQVIQNSSNPGFVEISRRLVMTECMNILNVLALVKELG